MNILSFIQKKISSILIFSMFVSVYFVAPTQSFAAEITAKEYNTIMNLSGKQRMLSQKMAKETLLIAKGVDVDENRQALKETTALFEKTLMGLRDGDQSLGLPSHDYKRIKRNLVKLEKFFNNVSSPYKKIIDGAELNIEELSSISENSPILLDKSRKIVGLFELEASEVADSHTAKLINLAGNQRMLTQKMTKEALLIGLKVDVDGNRQNLKESIDQFSQSLETLKSSDASISDQLKVVSGIWSEFKSILQVSSFSEEDFLKMKDLNIKLLEESQKTVQLLAS